jgi:hypothetical protein
MDLKWYSKIDKIDFNSVTQKTRITYSNWTIIDFEVPIIKDTLYRKYWANHNYNIYIKDMIFKINHNWIEYKFFIKNIGLIKKWNELKINDMSWYVLIP